jgi:endonuclease YncB( thermonuclease family)
MKILIFLSFLLNVSCDVLKGPARIVDGDTIWIRNTKIRLHGIDAPEDKQYCSGVLVGNLATEFLVNVTKEKEVECHFSSTDRYKRKLGTCFIYENQTKINLNKLLVKEGYAIAYRYFSKLYIEDEVHARTNKLNFWKYNCEEPYKFRKGKSRNKKAKKYKEDL